MTPDEQTPHSNQKYHQELEEQCVTTSANPCFLKLVKLLKHKTGLLTLGLLILSSHFTTAKKMKSYDRWMNNKVLSLKSYLSREKAIQPRLESTMSDLAHFVNSPTMY